MKPHKCRLSDLLYAGCLRSAPHRSYVFACVLQMIPGSSLGKSFTNSKLLPTTVRQSCVCARTRRAVGILEEAVVLLLGPLPGDRVAEQGAMTMAGCVVQMRGVQKTLQPLNTVPSSDPDTHSHTHTHRACIHTFLTRTTEGRS